MIYKASKCIPAYKILVVSFICVVHMNVDGNDSPLQFFRVCIFRTLSYVYMNISSIVF